MKRILFSIVMAFMIQPFAVESQVLINEVSSANDGNFTDNFGDHSDWIELYNAGASSVPLLGYGLSDNSSSLLKWTFPSVSIAPGGYLIVVASELNIKNTVNHWETAVLPANTWKYFVGNSNPDTNWRNLSFNDASWSSGVGGFGYADGDDGTIIPATRSVMLRKTFTISDTSRILEAVLNMDYDDGFVAFLNGVEIARNNLGTVGDRPSYSVLATTALEALMYQGGAPDSFYVSKSKLAGILRNGTNVLAVQVHNQSLTSSDLTSNAWLSFGVMDNFYTWNAAPSWFLAPPKAYMHTNFKLNKTGSTLYLSNASAVIVDQKAIPLMELDNSYGRSPDGGVNFCIFNPATPGTTNNASTCYSGYCTAPVFSLTAGFYTATQTLTLSTTQSGGVIRYTLDGNEPSASSTLYTSPLSISSSRMVKARVFAPGTLLPSVTVTNSYFINENLKLPIYSITMNPADLYDNNTGIYVMGPNASTTTPYFGANFWQDWPRTAYVEYFNKQKVRDFKFQTEISINGGYSRAKPQKSFELNLDDKYGTKEIVYPIIPDKSYITKWDDWILRNAGTDWLKVHYRDVLFEHTMKNTFLNYLAAEPCDVFMNGDYFGVYWQYENDDHNFVSNNFGFKKTEIDLLKESRYLETRQGSDTGFFALYNYVLSTPPTNPNFYATVDSKFDLENLTDYFAVETYMNNADWIGPWTNNIKLWRPTSPTIGKWKYILYDLDQCFGLNSNWTDNAINRARHPVDDSYQSPIFDALCNNATFKRYFINRYADLINTAFLPSKMISYAYALRDSIASDYPRTLAKYGGTVAGWNTYISEMVNSINQRPPYARSAIQTEFGLAGQVTLTLQASPAGSGHIIINTITPETLPWNGVYFNGNPVTITAVPSPGYTFNHWRSNVVITSNNTNQSVSYNFTANDVITAYFTGSAAQTQITFSEINYKSASSFDGGDWIEIKNYGSVPVDMTGWYFRDGDDSHKTIFPNGTILNPGSYIVLYEDAAKFSAKFPLVNNKLGPLSYGFDNTSENLRLYKWDNSLYLACKYSNAAPWPLTANGGGYTLELLSPTGNLNDGTNWFAGCLHGSPGVAYVPCCPITASISTGGPTTFCTGGNVLLTASAGTYSYQWLLNGINISGATSQTYSANASGSYTVNISDATCNRTSSAVTVTVNTAPPSVISLIGSAIICSGGSVLLNGNTGTGLTYKWQFNGIDIPGATLSSYSANADGSYTLLTTNSCGTTPSLPLIVTVISPPTATITPNGSTTFCSGGSVTLNANTGLGLTYQWKKNTVDISGATAETYVANTSGSFTVVVTNNCTSVTSLPVTVEVLLASASITPGGPTTICSGGNVLLTATTSGGGNTYEWYLDGIIIPTEVSQTLSATATGNYSVKITNGSCTITTGNTLVTVQTIPTPSFIASSTNICSGSSVLLTASPSGPEYSYAWKRNGNNISGATSQTYSPSPTTTGNYSVVVTNACGSYTSSEATITVNSIPSATITAGGPTTLCSAGSVLLTASSGSGYTYEWLKDGITIPSEVGQTYLAVASGNYSVKITIGVCSSTSNVISVTFGSMPTPTVTASATSICNGEHVLLTASPSGSGYTYRWRRNGSNISGATSQTYNPSPSSTATYSVRVTSSCGASTSSGVLITVNSLPQANISASGSTTFCAGQSVTFSASSGTGYTYQWRKNNIDIGGATARTYVATTTGSYRVVVTSAAGCSRTSSSRSVNVNCRLASGESEEISGLTIEVFPNPSSDRFTIRTITDDNNTKVQIYVFDLTGKSILMMTGINPNDDLVIGDEFSAGIYILEFIQGDQRKTFRLVKTGGQ